MFYLSTKTLIRDAASAFPAGAVSLPDGADLGLSSYYQLALRRMPASRGTAGGRQRSTGICGTVAPFPFCAPERCVLQAVESLDLEEIFPVGISPDDGGLLLSVAIIPDAARDEGRVPETRCGLRGKARGDATRRRSVGDERRGAYLILGSHSRASLPRFMQMREAPARGTGDASGSGVRCREAGDLYLYNRYASPCPGPCSLRDLFNRDGPDIGWAVRNRRR